MVDVRSRPGFTPTQATQITYQLYGIRGEATELPSDRDQNFRIRGDDGKQYVLKIANGQEEWASLDFENCIMRHVGAKMDGVVCPKIVGEMVEYEGFWVRLITFLPGRVLTTIPSPSTKLLQNIGYSFGQLNKALQDFTHPAMHRELHWDMKHAMSVTGRLIHHIADPERRKLAETVRVRFAEHVEPQLAQLRQSVIHHDGNEHNILVEDEQVTGIIDFGDAVYSCTVFEPATAAAYAILGTPAPLAVALHVVAGYHAAYPLTELELQLMPILIQMRLCTSVCVSSYQKMLEPDNAYITVSEAPAWNMLEKWQTIPQELTRNTFKLIYS